MITRSDDWIRENNYCKYGQSKGAFTGDYILAAASVSLAKLRHNRVMRIMSQILEDLVQESFPVHSNPI
ncbi:hypothetical protein EB796_015062 [Bugula neritina]|uniref:Uncharacterized protein n=1 Tax=Bugula neritina TaxID=10212 RepID=A0A7J7JKI0_BUGNE|nr:hypothetical protein EB796_015062 [Bugula neritina]